MAELMPVAAEVSALLMQRHGLNHNQAFSGLVHQAGRNERELVDEATTLLRSMSRERG
jgi:hypothetical protein